MVTGSISGQSMCLGGGFGPWLGCIGESSQLIFFSHINVSLPPSHSKTSIKKMSSGEDKKNKVISCHSQILNFGF